MTKHWTLALITALCVGCDGEDDGRTEPVDTATEDTGPSEPHWTPLSTDGLVSTWGSFPAGQHHVGGTAGLSMGGRGPRRRRRRCGRVMEGDADGPLL